MAGSASAPVAGRVYRAAPTRAPTLPLSRPPLVTRPALPRLALAASLSALSVAAVALVQRPADARIAPAVPAAPAAAAPLRFTIDAAHSSVTFKVKHLGLSTVSGRFGKFAGTFAFDSTNAAASAVDVTIDAASIDTDVHRRDTHLRSADFFDVEKYPTIRYVGNRIERAADGRYTIQGALTMHGVTKPVTLDAELGGARKTAQGWLVAVSATGRLKRSDFGLTWSRAVEGVAVVSEDVQIGLELEAKEEAPTAGPVAAPAR